MESSNRAVLQATPRASVCTGARERERERKENRDSTSLFSLSRAFCLSSLDLEARAIFPQRHFRSDIAQYAIYSSFFATPYCAHTLYACACTYRKNWERASSSLTYRAGVMLQFAPPPLLCARLNKLASRAWERGLHAASCPPYWCIL